MQSSSFWKRFIGTVESGDIDDLRRDMILEIGVATFIVGWLLTLAAIGYEGRLEYLPSAFILLAGSMAAPWLRNAHYRAATYMPIVTLLGAITCLQWLMPGSPAPYYFPVAIVVSSLLISSLRMFGVAAIASLACLMVSRWQGVSWFDSRQIVTPIFLIYLTAFGAWLGSRQ